MANYQHNTNLICGVDEAGRGPWAGPVFAAAVILNPEKPIQGLKDSKKLSPTKRNALFDVIQNQALSFGIGKATVEEIDSLNILRASLLAMERAVNQLNTPPSEVLIDGTHCPNIPFPARAIIKGDDKFEAIAAASILAKVTRDRIMVALDAKFPGYGFAKHKGYGTKQHAMQLNNLGPCPLHRKSFAPIKKALLHHQTNRAYDNP